MYNRDAYMLAVDLGASGGKMAAARFDGEKLHLAEYTTFANRPVQLPGALYWDVFSLYNSILDGMAGYAAKGLAVQSVGVDTWGATYGFLDGKGRLLEPVFHYRDTRTDGIVEPLFDTVSKRELFRLTGCQCNRTYTLPQLYASAMAGEKSLQNADKMLFLPDLLRYFLSGEISNERTIAGTSALMNTRQDEWEPEVFRRCGIPTSFLTGLVDAGTIQGTLLPQVAKATGVGEAEMVATVGHDSAAAVAAIPGFGPGKLYISIGTNVSMGIERTEPLVNDAAYEGGLKNTGGIGRSIITYRDFAAFWIINELRAAWKAEGNDYSFDQLHTLAENAKSPGAYINTELASLNSPTGDMRDKIRTYLAATGQPIPQDVGEWVRCVFESIALKVAYTAKVMRQASGEDIHEAFVINGGSRNTLLVQLIADALNLPVQAGMPYATLAGNLLCQLWATGGVGSIAQMRQVAKNTFTMHRFEPQHTEGWAEALENGIQKRLCT